MKSKREEISGGLRNTKITRMAGGSVEPQVPGMHPYEHWWLDMGRASVA
jgi:hypothetical protein